MNRTLQLIAGPELVLAAVTAVVYLVCSRYGSYNSADVAVLERLMWLLPLVVVAAAYSTLWLAGARTWEWLVRVNLAVPVFLTVCALRLVDGFGAPGSGPKGQDVGLLVVGCLGLGFSALGNVTTGAVIMRAKNAGFDEWYRARPGLAWTLTLLAAVPVAVVQSLVTGLVLGIAVEVHAAFTA